MDNGDEGNFSVAPSETPDGSISETIDVRLSRRASKILDKKRNEAEKIAGDPGALHSLVEKSTGWLGRFSNVLKPETKEGLTTIFRMIGAKISSEYPGFSTSSIALLSAALLYCVSPIDAIPDAIPILGLVDDAFVVAWTLQKLASETLTFRNWERIKTSKSTLATYLPRLKVVKRVVLCPGWMTENQTGEDVFEVLRPIFPNAAFEFYRWKANVSWSEARDYVDSEDASVELEAYLRRSPIELTNAVLIGHSLGARLATRTLARLSKEPQKRALWSRKPTNRLAQAFLMGAAVDADDPDLDAAVLGSNAPVCNFFNRADRVLGYLYRTAEQKTPLGLAGSAIERANYVDCVVSGREEYWLDVAGNVASVLSFLGSRSLFSKFSVAESLSQGLPEFHRHQFVQYATFFKESATLDS